jgi:hypothetical protein
MVCKNQLKCIKELKLQKYKGKHSMFFVWALVVLDTTSKAQAQKQN